LIYAVLAIAMAVTSADDGLWIIQGAELPMPTGNAGEVQTMAVQVASGTGSLQHLIWWVLTGAVAGAGGLAALTASLVLESESRRERPLAAPTEE
jgi:hypothetical protein